MELQTLMTVCYQELDGTVDFDDRLLPGAGWNFSSILLLVANRHQNLQNVPMPMHG